MSLTTSNKFGKIFISEEVVRTIAFQAASECYGVVDLVSRRFSDDFRSLVGKSRTGRGVSVRVVDNLIYIELFVVLKFGVNVEAVKKSLSDSVKFSVETITGMSVRRVHVNVVGIRV